MCIETVTLREIMGGQKGHDIAVSYVRGPQGQTVVIVPPSVPTSEKESSQGCCVCCMVISITFAAICLLLGTIYGASALPGNDWTKGITRDFAIATFSLLGIGGFFVLCSVYTCSYMKREKRKEIDQFMHKEGSPHSLAYRHAERLVEEEEAFTRNYEMFTPEIAGTNMGTPSRAQRDHSHRGYQAYRPDPTSMTMPSSRSPYHGYPQSGFNPSQHYGQSHVPSQRHSQPMEPMEYYPQHRSDYNPRRYTTEASSPYHSSPVGDRSFSPASDTTYLSNYTSGPETQQQQTPSNYTYNYGCI